MTEVKKPPTSSPSQGQTYLMCPRRWWWQSVRRMPERHDPANFASRAFGTAMHACFERWLLADDTGRNPDGTPVDPFPDGWDVVEERNKPTYRLDAGQRQNARELFGLCTRMGVVRRIPGRKVEDDAVVDCDGVAIKMVVDQWNADVVEDHKSTSKKKYALSSKELAADSKMLCYARWWFGLPQNAAAQTCRLRLNYFATKERLSPWAVEAVVERAAVYSWWDTVFRQVVREMVDYRAKDLPDERWAEVEGPREKGACEKYGREGCPYAPVCGGACSPAELRRRNQPVEVRGTDMGLGKKIVDARATEAPAAGAVTPPQVPTSAPAEKVEAPSPRAQETLAHSTDENGADVRPEPAAIEAPPWHAKQCQACVKTPGINSKGHPCRACDNYAQREGRPGSGAYAISHEGGKMTWTLRAGAAAPAPVDPSRGASLPVVQTPTPGAESPKAEAAAPAPEAPKKTRKPKAEAAAPTAAAPTPVVEASGKDAVLSVVQPGFVLYVNCVPLKQEYEDLTSILEREGRELAGAVGVASFYEIDAFKRRDMLASAVRDVARQLEGKNVVAVGAGQDMKNYLEALRPLARFVVVGTF